jgi:hypothetical protein
VLGNALRSGMSQSCGCLHREAVSTHGRTGSPEFTVWQMMIQRCTNTNHNSYADYGGRGIRVCQRWLDSFAAFFSDMGERPSAEHTIDRTDNSGNYSPENCRWATRLEQGSNRRNVRMLTLAGETLSTTQWARRLGISNDTITERIRYGWSVEDTLTRPVSRSRRRA